MTRNFIFAIDARLYFRRKVFFDYLLSPSVNQLLLDLMLCLNASLYFLATGHYVYKIFVILIGLL